MQRADNYKEKIKPHNRQELKVICKGYIDPKQNI